MIRFFKQLSPHFIWLSLVPIVAAILYTKHMCGFDKILFDYIFWGFAIFQSITLGFNAFEIHTDTPPLTVAKLDPWRLNNEYWFNMLGILLGWIAIYILFVFRINGNMTEWANKININDFVLILVAYLGVTGYIPYVSLIKGLY